MFAPDDTIAAIATPPGRGGIGVVRISGPRAHDIALTLLARPGALAPRVATLTRLRTDAEAGHASQRADNRAESAGVTDEVIVTFFPAPHSYTGQDVVEVSAHGSPVILHGIVAGSCRAGARLAERGEFTLRAFLNGKRDLVQAEAVADLVNAVTPLQARTAFDQLEGTLTERIAGIDGTLYALIARLEASLDFPDEGYHFIATTEIAAAIDQVIGHIDRLLADAQRGRMIRDGSQVVIAGRPNVGKSSLFNALVGADRAIVTEVPGTTRDLITECVDINGLAVTLVDTAGVRDTLDLVEREGVARGDRARDVADLILVVIDASAATTEDDRRLLERAAGRPRVIVYNKVDRADEGASALPLGSGVGGCAVRVSAATGVGMQELRDAIRDRLLAGEPLREAPAISNTRHVMLLEAARGSLVAAHAAAAAGAPEEFVLCDLQAARQRFDEIVGRRTTDDLLSHIFERFCIGK